MSNITSVNLPRCYKTSCKEIPRCSKETTKKERKPKEPKRFQLMGRECYYVLPNGEAIIRGFRSQNSNKYSEHSRNNQDIPNSIVSIVMHHICPVDKWNSQNIDMILDVGNQLYRDSYIACGPKDNKLGVENIMRKFHMNLYSIHVTIYKPIYSAQFYVVDITKA